MSCRCSENSYCLHCQSQDITVEDDLGQIQDPYEYLDRVADDYRDMELKAAYMSLEEYLDRRQAQYREQGLKKGVGYIDEIDENREELEDLEEED